MIAQRKYDSLGNMVRSTVRGAVTEYSHNRLNQLVGRLAGGNAYTYTFDGRGNLVESRRNGGFPPTLKKRRYYQTMVISANPAVC